MATKDALAELRAAAERLGQLPLRRLSVATETAGPLSVRQRRVLVALAEGRSDGEAAAELGVELNTVKSHIKRLFVKLNARNRAHAVHIGWQLGYLRAGALDERES